MYKISIECVTLVGHVPDGSTGSYRPAAGTECFKRNTVATYRFNDGGDYAKVVQMAARMLTAWLEANPGQLATYVITGLSAADRGESQ